MGTERTLSTKEVCEQLGITPARVHQLIRAGRLAAVKTGRDYRFDASEVERFRTLPRSASGSFRYDG